MSDDVEPLVIRHALGWDGVLNPTRDDILRVLEDIESGACARPEFSIEQLKNVESAIVDGRRVLRYARRGCAAFAATFYHDDDTVSWYVTFRNSTNPQWALSTGTSDQQFIDGILCGAPFKLRNDCAVSIQDTLDALVYFASYRERSPQHAWIPEPESWILS